MRHYDDPIEVRRGGQSGGEEPDQFLWRGKLWQVKEVVAYWVETGAWWLGGKTSQGGSAAAIDTNLLDECEIWRVMAVDPGARLRSGRVVDPSDSGAGFGVFDLAFNWAEGRWRLARAMD